MSRCVADEDQVSEVLLHALKVDPLLKNLHSHPRYAALLQKLKVPAEGHVRSNQSPRSATHGGITLA